MIEASVLSGETFYLGAAAQALIMASAETLPADTTLLPELIPASYGFLRLEQPLRLVMPYEDGEDVEMQMSLITWALVRPADEDSEIDLVVLPWQQAKNDLVGGQRLPHLPTSALAATLHHQPLHEAVIHPSLDADNRGWKQGQEEAALVILRFVMAAFLFMQQRMTIESQMPAPRAERRRLEKESPEHADRLVRVIMLRKREYSPGERDLEQEGEKRTYSVQWPVSMHWRQQYYPSDGSHRPKLIMPYMKGDPAKPLKVSPVRLTAVVR